MKMNCVWEITPDVRALADVRRFDPAVVIAVTAAAVRYRPSVVSVEPSPGRYVRGLPPFQYTFDFQEMILHALASKTRVSAFVPGLFVVVRECRAVPPGWNKVEVHELAESDVTITGQIAVAQAL